MAETATQGTAYAIDVRASRLTIHAYAGGFLAAVGHDPVIAVGEFPGELRFAPEPPGAGAMHLRIAAASLAVMNDASDKDRREMERTMRDEVLEIVRYPEIVYEASQARVEKMAEGRYRVEVEGRLSLHGVTRTQRVAAKVFLARIC